ncbi:unnamed protein product, partial [Didymodactylos carnosus]
EDVRTWIQRIELLFDLADYTKFKWIKLTALHLTDHALCWYNANKNKFHDWDVFCQMLIKQYSANPTPATTTSQTIQVDDNNLTIPRQNDLLVTEIPTIRQNHSSTNLLNKELSFTDSLNKPSSSTKFSNSSSTKDFFTTMVEHKMKQLPTFSGKDSEKVQDWLENIKQIGKMVNWTAEQLSCIATLKLEGDAQKWYLKNQDKILDWDSFHRLLSQRFPAQIPNQREQLRQLVSRKQGLNETISKYYRDILNLCDQYDPNMLDSSKIGYLQDGLRPELQHYTLSQQISTPQQFFNIMQQHETIQGKL